MFVTSDGHVKLLDFGLAKEIAPVRQPDASAVPTQLLETHPGQMLGTVGYMASEQVRGQDVDAGTDLFACGVVLYELLAGHRPFEGATAADTMGAILGKDPVDLPSTADRRVPPGLQRIVTRCLEKEPAARFQSAADLAFALQTLSTESGMASGPVAPQGARRPHWDWRVAALVLVAAGATTAAALLWVRQPTAPTQASLPVAQLEVPLASVIATRRITVSPDGQWLTAAEPGGSLQLRSVRDGTVRVVPERAASSLVVWAPDSSAVVYLAETGLRRLRIGESESTAVWDWRGLELADVTPISFLGAAATGAWSADGQFVLSGRRGDVVSTDVARQSKARLILASRPGITRRIVGFLGKSSTFLFIESGGSTAGLFRSDVTSAEVVRLDQRPWDAGVVVGRDSVLLQRDDSIFHALIAPDRRSLREPVLVSTQTVDWFAWGASQNGMLASVPQVDLRFRWFSRDGRALEFVGPVGAGANFKMDVSGGRIVARRAGDGRRKLWILDLARGTEERLTFGETADADPVWSRDGRRVAYASGSEVNAPVVDLFVAAAGQPPQHVHTDKGGTALDDWSPDGRWLLYHRRAGLSTQPRGSLLAAAINQAAEPVTAARCEGASRPGDDSRQTADGWRSIATNRAGTRSTSRHSCTTATARVCP